LGDLRHGELLVAAGHALDVLLGGGRRGRRLLGRRGRGFLRRCGLRAWGERDLHARRGGAEAVVALVAGAALVLADADLRAALVRVHLHRDGGVAEQDVRAERPALVRLQAVDDQRLALADAVLLPSETDDRVVHRWKKRGRVPASGASVATGVTSRPTPTRSSACSPSLRRSRRRRSRMAG